MKTHWKEADPGNPQSFANIATSILQGWPQRTFQILREDMNSLTWSLGKKTRTYESKQMVCEFLLLKFATQEKTKLGTCKISQHELVSWCFYRLAANMSLPWKCWRMMLKIIDRSLGANSRQGLAKQRTKPEAKRYKSFMTWTSKMNLEIPRSSITCCFVFAMDFETVKKSTSCYFFLISSFLLLALCLASKELFDSVDVDLLPCLQEIFEMNGKGVGLGQIRVAGVETTMWYVFLLESEGTFQWFWYIWEALVWFAANWTFFLSVPDFKICLFRNPGLART